MVGGEERRWWLGRERRVRRRWWSGKGNCSEGELGEKAFQGGLLEKSELDGEGDVSGESVLQGKGELDEMVARKVHGEGELVGERELHGEEELLDDAEFHGQRKVQGERAVQKPEECHDGYGRQDRQRGFYLVGLEAVEKGGHGAQKWEVGVAEMRFGDWEQ